MQAFSGLIHSQLFTPAWSSGLWGSGYRRVVATWGGAANVVLGDGVEDGEFVTPLIELNARASAR
jgi:hypothetical protein